MRKKSGWKSFNFYSKRNFKRISVNFCLTVDVRRPDVGTNYSGPAAVRRSGRFRNERLFEWWLPISTTCQLPRRAVSTFLLRWRTPIRLLSKVTLSALSDHQMTSGSLLQWKTRTKPHRRGLWRVGHDVYVSAVNDWWYGPVQDKTIVSKRISKLFFWCWFLIIINSKKNLQALTRSDLLSNVTFMIHEEHSVIFVFLI